MLRHNRFTFRVGQLTELLAFCHYGEALLLLLAIGADRLCLGLHQDTDCALVMTKDEMVVLVEPEMSDLVVENRRVARETYTPGDQLIEE